MNQPIAPTKPRPSLGFVYVATGTAYVTEAADSARTLRQFHQEPIWLITNEQVDFPIFNQVIIKSDLKNDVSSKLFMNQVPFDRFVFLDSDTVIAAPLDELFELMDAFDVAVPASLGGYHYQLPGVPAAFREPSTNVIAFRQGPAVENLFVKWQHYFAEYETVMGREWDQRSFRHALYECRDVRACFLGDEWSLSPYPGGVLCRDVKIFHGRPRSYLTTMERQVNARAGYRVFWRGFPMLFEPRSMRVTEYARLLIAVVDQGVRAVARAILRRK